MVIGALASNIAPIVRKGLKYQQDMRAYHVEHVICVVCRNEAWITIASFDVEKAHLVSYFLPSGPPSSGRINKVGRAPSRGALLLVVFSLLRLLCVMILIHFKKLRAPLHHQLSLVIPNLRLSSKM